MSATGNRDNQSESADIEFGAADLGDATEPSARSASKLNNYVFCWSKHEHVTKGVVVVTGASQGIGAEVVKVFRKLDYRVVATSRSIAPSEDPNILTVTAISEIRQPLNASFPKEPWRGLLYGMSVSDVRWRIPSAYVPTSATKIRRPDVGDAVELLRIDNVISLTHDFTARLYFRCKRLQQVTLSHHHEASKVLLMDGFGALSTKLRRAYGPESGHESKSCLALDIDVLS